MNSMNLKAIIYYGHPELFHILRFELIRFQLRLHPI